MESILTSIKKLLGIAEDYEHFDGDITIHINSVLSVLNQIGVGPSEGYSIIDKNDYWTDFIGEKYDIEMVKSYVYLKVKLIFDPPVSSAHMEAIKSQIAEYEWRLMVATDTSEEVNQNGV